MNKLKNLLIKLTAIPDKLYNEFIKKTLCTILLIIFMECFVIYTRDIYIIICSQVMIILLLFTVVYEYKSITSGQLITLEGTCISVHSISFISKKSQYNYIIMEVAGKHYRCNLPSQKITKYYAGCPITVYAISKNISADTLNACNYNVHIINHPLYVIPYI